MSDAEEMASCPYNANHRFTRAKLTFHINKCKDKSKIGHMFATCRFNVHHIVPKENLVQHYEECQDKIKKLKIMRELQVIKEECKDIIKEKDEIQVVKSPPKHQLIRVEQPTEVKQEEIEIQSIEKLSDCHWCRDRLADYLASSNRNQELDEVLNKLLMKFDSMTSDLIKLEPQ